MILYKKKKEKDINEDEDDDPNSLSPPFNQQKQLPENIGYICSKCSSLIEVCSIYDGNLSFKCEKNHVINNSK